MTVYALFNELREKGIKLWHEDGQLKFRAAKGSLTEDIRQKLITNKSDIVVFLQQLSAAKNIPPILNIDRSQFDRLPLSFAQERLWVIEQMNGDSTSYNIPGAVRIDGELNIKHVEETFNIIIARHESLRTTFPNKEGYPEQLIADNVDFNLEFIDYSHLKKQKTRNEKAKQYCEIEATSSFDLERGPLIRGAIIRLSLQEHILMMNMHHIISDGWSIGVLINEFSYIMDKLDQGDIIDLPLMPIQYVDYSIWQRQWFEESGILTKQLNYWQDKLTGVASSLEVVFDYPRPSIQSFAGAKQKFTIDRDTCEHLKILTKHQGCTFYMTLLAAFKVLMYRYTGQEDICIGSPIANRQYGETEDLIGMFVNTLALRDQLVSDDSFATVLDKVRTTCLQAYENQDIPFEKIVDLVQPQRNMATSPLFQIMVVLQNTPMKELEGYIPLDTGSSQFDLTIEFTESSGELQGSIEYCTALYKEHTIERMITHFIELCHAIIRTPEAKISELNYIAQLELEQLQTEFNKTKSDYLKGKCIHQLFAEQVKSVPEKIAISFQNEQLSYQQLYDKSYDLALYLQSKGVTADSLVGLCVERSSDMIVGILGILMAGGAYVPLDPKYPDERLAFMLQDSQVDIVITQEQFNNKLGSLGKQNIQLLVIDLQPSMIQHAVDNLKHNNVTLRQEVKAHHLAYIIYTSGTTGQPKGVMVEHKSVVNMILSQIELFSITPDDNCLQNFSVCFDGAVYEMYMALLSGARLIISPQEEKNDPVKLLGYIKKHKVTIATIIPSFLAAIGEEVLPLRILVTAGESANKEILKFHSENKVECYNAYGPTETSVCATYYKIKLENINSNSIPIGIPIANTQIYILDQNNQIVPTGIPGELHIAGEGLARGYLNRSELTQDKFVDNPFKNGTRMYKSGDLARWLDDGNIEYLGRIDTQIKIRGFRIETGEIENKLNLLAEITESVVVAQGEASNKQLIAFYLVEDNENKLTDDDLRQYLQKSLPEYMLPAAFVCLETIPLTSNGKVDRRVLEQMEVQLKSDQEYQAPANNTEKELVDIWAEVLSLSPDNIGVNDNFFSLGGHSLSATVVIAKIRSIFKVELSIFSLFEQGCIKHLAKVITNTNKLNVNSIQTIDRKNLSLLPLSYAQERLWFINQLEPNTAVYNIPGAVSIRGELDVCLVQEAFNQIIVRHENLRTIFPDQTGVARQQVLDSVNFKLKHVDLSRFKTSKTRHSKAQKLCHDEASTPFDLANGPLIRGMICKLTSQEHILMLNMHHIISDGWSIGILIEEFSLIIEGLDKGVPITLPELPIQYLDYSIWQRQCMEQEGLLNQQLDYWQDKLKGLPQSLPLPTDFPRPREQKFAGATQEFSLEKQLCDQLKRLALEQDSTLYMTLLTVFKVLFYRYTNQEDICIGTPIANRQYAETENLIGMFVNTLALRSVINGNDSFIDVLSIVKNTCLEAYEHQDTPFDKIVDRVQPNRNMAIHPLFQIMVILQNTAVPSLDEQIQAYPLETNLTKFDLTVEFTETPDGLAMSIEYNTCLYKQTTIERIYKHFTTLCEALIEAPSLKINQLNYLNEVEKKQVLIDFNQTQLKYTAAQCIHESFTEQVTINPDKVAIVYGEEQLSYQQLYDKSYDLALYLQSKGVTADSLVGLCVERSSDMIVGMLGILMAGGAYVPLDPEYPDKRLAFMLQDSQVDIVITQKQFHNKLDSFGKQNIQLLVMDLQPSVIKHVVDNLKHNNVTLCQEVKSHHLAYVIYTSGSTGQPKGVAVEHKSVVNMILSQIELFSITPDDNCLQNFSVCFDGAVYEMYMALLSGARLIISPQEEKNDPVKLLGYIKKHKVTIATIIPSFLAAIGEEVLPLRILVTAGESANKEILKFHSENKVECYNAYGPTETSVCATYYKIKLENINSNSIPIGIPIANTQIYILDQNNQIVPTGIPGELHIAGEGLARGYLNRSELTQDKFVDNPFKNGTRMYKSGDLARWLDDGNIEYLGRIDTQIKIRGFRIETGEIEARLNKHPKIKDSVVVTQGEASNKQLIAFFQASETKTNNIIDLDNEVLRLHLQQILPDYMMPAAFKRLEALPLTSNGKVDRRTLEHMLVSIESSQKYVAPSNDIEKELVNIWALVLNLRAENIGVNDNFFELGGHSLLATQLLSKIRSQFEIDLPLKTIFAFNSLADIGEVINVTKIQQKQSLASDEVVEYEDISL